MRPGIPILVHLVFASLLFASAPRVTFERIVPAAHDLAGAEDVAIVQAIGDTPKIESFIEHFVEHTNKSGLLRVRDVSRRTIPVRKDPVPGPEAYLSIRAFTCTTTAHGGEAGTYDPDRNRIRTRQVWIDATCTARMEVIDAKGARSTYMVRGEGSSAHVSEITDDQREDALEHAAYFAAVSAAEQITPRRIRESIPLEETAPAFEEAVTLIESGRLAEVRTMWEREAKREPRSAPLHYNLGAVSEALGDRKAAEQHYVTARELAPNEPKYKSELRLFMRRNQRP